MSHFKAKMHQIRNPAGEAHRAPLNPLAMDLRGPTFNGRGGEGKSEKKGEKKGEVAS